jgi:hypothetical protein
VEAWPASRGSDSDHRARGIDSPAYDELVKRLTTEGLSEEEARCGVLEIAGQSTGAAFVGAATEVLRVLCDGPRYQVIGLSLRSPGYRDAALNENPGPPVNPGFVASA